MSSSSKANGVALKRSTQPTSSSKYGTSAAALFFSYFIENSFQNWTRQSSDIMGTAFLYVDYSIPVEDLRKQLEAVVHPSPLWDKQVCGLQVTNLTDRSMELRCLISSRNASENFDLRCLVREKMTAWIQENYPDAFPTTRFTGHSQITSAQTDGQGLSPIPAQQSDRQFSVTLTYEVAACLPTTPLSPSSPPKTQPAPATSTKTSSASAS